LIFCLQRPFWGEKPKTNLNKKSAPWHSIEVHQKCAHVKKAKRFGKTKVRYLEEVSGYSPAAGCVATQPVQT